MPHLVNLLLAASLGLLAQTSELVKLIPLGQVDPAELRRILAVQCGPYFTLAPTDARGGGFLNLAIEREGSSTQIVSVLLGAGRLRWCDECDQPTATVTRADNSYRVDLTMSRDQWKVSPCLRNVKAAK